MPCGSSICADKDQRTKGTAWGFLLPLSQRVALRVDDQNSNNSDLHGLLIHKRHTKNYEEFQTPVRLT